MDLATVREEDDRLLFPLDELQRELTELENGSSTSLSDSELQEKMRVIDGNYIVRAPTLPVGSGFYRAVKVSQRPANKKRVSYPLAEMVQKNRRLNSAGEVMFYGAFHLMTCLEECSWQVGEFFAVSGWLTTQPMTSLIWVIRKRSSTR